MITRQLARRGEGDVTLLVKVPKRHLPDLEHALAAVVDPALEVHDGEQDAAAVIHTTGTRAADLLAAIREQIGTDVVRASALADTPRR